MGGPGVGENFTGCVRFHLPAMSRFCQQAEVRYTAGIMSHESPSSAVGHQGYPHLESTQTSLNPAPL